MIFRRIWAAAFLAVGFIATAGWIGPVGYELFKLDGQAFSHS